MAGIFNLQIVTPEREVFNGPVEMVSLPGLDGSFGVLRNHAPLIAALDAGVVSIFDPDGAEDKLAIGGGFFQVAKNQAIILADSAEFAHEINLEQAQESLTQAQSRTRDGRRVQRTARRCGKSLEAGTHARQSGIGTLKFMVSK